jgi:putative transposase
MVAAALWNLLPIPRPARKAADGQVYHALNRSVGGMHLFHGDADLEAFQHDVIEALRRDPIRILSYCILSNDWHFVVWPETDGQVTKKKGRRKGMQCGPMPPNGSRAT